MQGCGADCFTTPLKIVFENNPKVILIRGVNTQDQLKLAVEVINGFMARWEEPCCSEQAEVLKQALHFLSLVNNK